MSSTLGLADSMPNANVAALTPEQISAQANQVRKLGIIALLLLLTIFIPILNFFGLIASLILSRKALRISRENLLPIEVEKPAYWASLISTTMLVFGCIGVVLVILKS